MPIRLQSGPDAAGVFRMLLGELIVEFAPGLGRLGGRKPKGGGRKPKPSPLIGRAPPGRRNPIWDPIVTYIVDPNAPIARLGGAKPSGPAIVDLDLSELVIGPEHVEALANAVARLPWSAENAALKAQLADPAAAEQLAALLQEIMGDAAPRLDVGVARPDDGAAG